MLLPLQGSLQRSPAARRTSSTPQQHSSTAGGFGHSSDVFHLDLQDFGCWDKGQQAGIQIMRCTAGALARRRRGSVRKTCCFVMFC